MVDPAMLTEIARNARDHFTLRFDYSDRRQEASQRRVEPYRIVNAGQRWYLVAWDLDREDWRTFRVDRMREGMSPGPRFTPRELTDADAEALVARGVPVEARQHQAWVVVQAPAAELVERWGPMLGTVTPIDETQLHDPRRRGLGGAARGLAGHARRRLPGHRAAGAPGGRAGAVAAIRGRGARLTPSREHPTTVPGRYA